MSKIQQIFNFGFDKYREHHYLSDVEQKAAYCIMNCKTGTLGYNISECSECGHIEIHANSCRNRNCPNCQAILKEIWVDNRRSELIDSDYYHIVFTVPSSLNNIIYDNQRLLYSLLHKCSSETLLEFSLDEKHLGVVPGIIQILHTWGQKLNYHPHIHAIISAGGLTKDTKQLKTLNNKFLFSAKALAKMFRGKFVCYLNNLYEKNKINFSTDNECLINPYEWQAFKDSLYSREWNIEVKETINANGNAVEYFGRYANRIAITNARVISVTETNVAFKAKNYKSGEQEIINITPEEFIERFMRHVLPSGFQKIRYYGFLNNRYKNANLTIIFNQQNKKRHAKLLAGLSTAEIIYKLYNYDIRTCRKCGCINSMQNKGFSYSCLRC